MRPAAARESAPALHDLRLHKEAVQVIQHGSPVEERQLARCRLGQKAQELFAHAGKAVRPQGERQTFAADDIVAQNGHGAAVHGLVIVRHTRQQQAEAVFRQHAVFRQGGDQAAERPERRRGGASAAAAQQAVEEVDAFADLLFRHGAQQPSEITGDEACDLLLPVFQLAHEVDDDLVALVDAQARADGQKRAPGVLAHGRCSLTDSRLERCVAVWNVLPVCCSASACSRSIWAFFTTQGTAVFRLLR